MKAQEMRFLGVRFTPWHLSDPPNRGKILMGRSRRIFLPAETSLCCKTLLHTVTNCNFMMSAKRLKVYKSFMTWGIFVRVGVWHFLPVQSFSRTSLTDCQSSCTWPRHWCHCWCIADLYLNVFCMLVSVLRLKYRSTCWECRQLLLKA